MRMRSHVVPVSAALALACLALACGGTRQATSFPGAHLILISLDTTRADHLGCYGSRTAATPALDRLAKGGMLFTDVTTAATTTLASHTSIMTGLYPHHHGVPENGWVVGVPNTLLAELLSARGYRSEAVVGSFALASRFGLDQGFERWDERFDLLLHPKLRDQNQRRAAQVTDAAIAALGRRTGAPLFLLVHYFDPHPPYDPPAPARAASPTPDLEALRRLVSKHQKATTGRDHGGLQVVFKGLTRELLRGATGEVFAEDRIFGSLYAGEISYMDTEIGRLLRALETQGILERAVVLVVADHGETLWEHADTYNHGLALYQTTVRVPLILRLPGGLGAGRRIDTPVSTVDILPTVLELLGIQPPEKLDGVSLAGLIAGRSLARGPIFSGATQPADSRFDPPRPQWRNASRARAVRDGRWKLIRTPYLDYEELYDLQADPEERRNLLLEADAGVEREAARLRSLLESWARSANPLPSFASREHIEEVRERLRALGYL